MEIQALLDLDRVRCGECLARGSSYGGALERTVGSSRVARLPAMLAQLSSSSAYGESRAAYREVQERQADIQRIERTLEELAQLFNDVRLYASLLRKIQLTGYLLIPDERPGQPTR